MLWTLTYNIIEHIWSCILNRNRKEKLVEYNWKKINYLKIADRVIFYKKIKDVTQSGAWLC